jgi:hypothetical protein
VSMRPWVVQIPALPKKELSVWIKIKKKENWIELHEVFGYFWNRVSGTICLDWPQTTILLICASWVTRIIGMSHQRLADFLLFDI